MTNLEIISVNLWNIIISLCNLLILFLIIKIFLFKRVEKVLADRHNAIELEYSNASAALADAQAKQNEWQEKLDSADAEAERRVKMGEERAGRSYDRIIGEADERAARIIENAELQAKAEKEKAAAEIKDDIAEVSVEIARKLLEKELSAQEHRRLIDDALKEMEENGDTDQ